MVQVFRITKTRSSLWAGVLIRYVSGLWCLCDVPWGSVRKKVVYVQASFGTNLHATKVGSSVELIFNGVARCSLCFLRLNGYSS